MKCPHCQNELSPIKDNFLFCRRCGFMYLDKVKDDAKLSAVYKYDIMNCKNGDPHAVFEKATGKYDNGTYEVVGCRLERGKYSLLFGQEFTIIKRKK